MAKKYIDAEKLTEALREKCDGCKDKWTDYCTTCCDVVQLIEMIDNADDADVVERKKGRWLNKGRKICCSVCGRTNFAAPNFCPDCGTDTRREETK